MQRPSGFHPKKGRFGKKCLVAISKGGEDGGASSSQGVDEEEMSEKGDTTEELAKVVLAALTSHRKGRGKSFSKEEDFERKGPEPQAS